MILVMKNNFFQKMIAFCLMAMMVTCVWGQRNSGDNLYREGQEYQKKMTIKSQQTAIEKFTAAKKLYDNTDNKQKCDDAIEVSKTIIRELKKPKKENKTPVQIEPKSELTIGVDTLNVDYDQREAAVSVSTTESSWTAIPLLPSEGDSFVTLTKDSSNKSVHVSCPENISTEPRLQKVEIKSGDLFASFMVVQKGKPIVLDVSEVIVEINAKGNKKEIEVYCNSDKSYSSNSQLNWEVKSKPDWIRCVGEKPKQSGLLSNVYEKTRNVIAGKDKKDIPSDCKCTILSILADSKDKKAPSRSGDIIIESGNQRITILVKQN